MTHCRNCDAELTGPYCARCGQRDLPPDPSFGELFAEAWDAFVNLDGRAVQTFRLLLLRPGELTVRYLAGKRAAFLPPLRLYLIMSVAFFLVQQARDVDPVVNFNDRGSAVEVGAGNPAAAPPVVKVQGSEKPLPEWEARIKRGALSTKNNKQAFSALVREHMPKAIFLLVPLYALLLAGVYWRRKIRLPGHMIFALHGHAYVFAVFLVTAVAKPLLPKPVVQWVEGPALLTLCWWFPVALRRVYGGSWPGTIARSLLIGTAYLVMAVVVLGALLGIGFYIVGRAA
jgi:hypothetical protein